MLKHNPDEPIVKGWTLDRRINIYGTLGLCAAIASWVWNVQSQGIENQRMITQNKEIHDLEIGHLKASASLTEEIAATRFTALQTQLARMEDKLEIQMNRIEDKVERHTESPVNHTGGER